MLSLPLKCCSKLPAKDPKATWQTKIKATYGIRQRGKASDSLAIDPRAN